MNNIDETHEVVVSKIKDYVNSLMVDNFVFGNIAFSKDGENAINIGSKLDLGESYKHNKQLQESLEKENATFGESLNALDSFSISKYLQMANLKCFELCLNGCKKKLVLHNFDINIKPINIVFEKGLFSFVGNNQSIVPHYTDDYKPNTEGIHDASVAFNHTIDFYTQFHKLVVNTPNDEGYIYLIRPSVIDNAFSALAYMYLKSALCKKDIEIISYYLSNYFLELLKDKAYKESIKSAKAAIMSRNMSHNLGSHVMAYLKNDLRNVPSIFASKVLHELYPNYFKPDNPVTNETNDIIDKVELPFLVGLGNFIGYLQERQDYIATIASSYIPSYSPVNFKDSVYDELNPDKRFERHNANDPNNHNRPQNILLSYIAKSEKLSRLNSGDTNDHDIKLGFKYAGKIFGIDSNESNNETLAEMRHVNFALPGGIVGRQALFSIVENIIRNAAKHNNVQGDLHLIFEAIDGEELKNNPDAFKDSISSPSIRELYKNSNHIEDLIILTITDNQVCEEATIKKLREALREPYVGPNAQLNKGIKEIRISSTWLRGVDDDELFALCPMDENEPIPKNQMAPSVVIEKSKEGNLRYAICLRKTYEFALVYGKEDDESTKTAFVDEFKLKEDSYKVVSEETIKDSDTCYEYIIAKDSNVFDNIRPHVTNRCINKDKIPISVKVSLKNGSSVYTPESIYQTYTGIDENSPSIVIDDPKHPKQIIYKKKIKTKRDSKEKCYMYRSHHFAELDFGAYWVERWSRLFKGEIACIDAITGDNSSDRLVRREKLDKKWYTGHLYAMQSRVAIFDERLFQIIHGLDESQMTSGKYSTTEYSIKCRKGKWPKKPLTGRNLRDFAINVLHIPSNETPNINRFSELYSDCIKDFSIENRNLMTEFLEPFCFKFKDNVEGHRHLTAAYKEKGVDVYTIIPLGKKECIVVGCSPYKYKCIKVKIQQNGTKKKVPKPVYQFHFEPVAQIKFNEETKNFDVKIKAKKLFRYLSIHQGLIDKMYTEFGINDNDSKSKKDLLHKFYNAFMEEPDIENIDAFMPRMTIHSGRGHITEKDMPNQQPFLQYSAIEHAVLDCKYSLVELLDFAKYKKS